MSDELLPAWLVSKVDQRLAMVEEALASMPIDKNMTIVMTPLTEPPDGATPQLRDKWERSCDNCATYSPPDWNFFTGHIIRELSNGVQVAITFGVCQTCYNRMPR